jgi:hypothetical protein
MGCRKGCSLSPLLFFLVVKGLSRIIETYKRNEKLKGVQIERGLSIFPFLFVDDVLLFRVGSIREVGYLKKNLYIYSITTIMEKFAYDPLSNEVADMMLYIE